MIAMQYNFTLPADYDMGIVERRITEKGPLLDDFPKLKFKAYLSAARDDEALAAVLNALHYHSGVPLERVHVEVHGGRCVLSGVVAQEFQRELAEKTAASAEGVIEVQNLIVLAS